MNEVKDIMKIVGALFGIIMLSGIATYFLKSSGPQHICPITGCGQKFNTYAELEQHFTTAHPTEPIDIIWQ